MQIFVNYKQHAEPDHEFARCIAERLRSEGHQVFRDESNIVPSEEWPPRIEKEVRACDTMVSLLSNAALQSKWVLNEIDLALKLKKRMLPLLLEEIDDSLHFQALIPRFMSIQWLTSSGDREKDLEAVCAALREVRIECYRDLVTRKLDQYAIDDGREVLESLFGVLYQAHWPAMVTGQAMIDDPKPRLNGELACSLAESLRNHIETWASMKEHNSHNYHEHGQEDHAKRLSWQVQRLKCAADILNTLIAGWTRNSMAKRRAFPPSKEPHVPMFDNSDGEQAFVSPDAPMVQGGRPDKPVPEGQVVHMVLVPNPHVIGRGAPQTTVGESSRDKHNPASGVTDA
jgi:hypothetical protein